MTIAIDYDDTFSADPLLWDAFIRQAQKHGHKVVIVTMRGRDQCGDIYRELSWLLIKVDVYATGTTMKRHYMEQVANPPVRVDIWIDDMPETIGTAHLL